MKRRTDFYWISDIHGLHPGESHPAEAIFKFYALSIASPLIADGIFHGVIFYEFFY